MAQYVNCDQVLDAINNRQHKQASKGRKEAKSYSNDLPSLHHDCHRDEPNGRLNAVGIEYHSTAIVERMRDAE